ncbi:MAG: hypothetical protein ACHQDE_09945, partial [Acidimicrobiia bacterium]
ERVGALLEVAALDDVTKRRLVSTAMRQSKPALPVRWIAAAAAVLLLVIGGAVLLLAPGSRDDRQVATPARTPAAKAAEAPGPTAADRADAAPSASAGSAVGTSEPVDIGDFGDLSKADNLARLEHAATPATPDNKAAIQRTGALMAELATRPCRTSLPAGSITAVGTGTLDHQAAIIVITTTPNGEPSIDAVLGEPCTVRPLG